MTEVLEIEKAIEKLDAREFAELSSWWEKLVARKAGGGEPDKEAKLEALRLTSGCMAGEEGESFEKAVAEAGRGLADSHEW